MRVRAGGHRLADLLRLFDRHARHRRRSFFDHFRGDQAGDHAEHEALGATITVDSPLVGGHQKRNVALAIAAAVELADRHGVPITAAALEEGIRCTYWPGRLERIRAAGVEWILDVAHNPAGAWALRTGLPDFLGSRRPQALIFSCLRDKPLKEMAQILFPLFE